MTVGNHQSGWFPIWPTPSVHIPHRIFRLILPIEPRQATCERRQDCAVLTRSQDGRDICEGVWPRSRGAAGGDGRVGRLPHQTPQRDQVRLETCVACVLTTGVAYNCFLLFSHSKPCLLTQENSNNCRVPQPYYSLCGVAAMPRINKWQV